MLIEFPVRPGLAQNDVNLLPNDSENHKRKEIIMMIDLEEFTRVKGEGTRRRSGVF